MSADTRPARRGWLERIALHRPELRAWAMYDWANSATVTVIITAVFPIYFAKVASDGVEARVATERFAWITTASLLIAALLSPFLGALADAAAAKKKLLGTFMGLGVGASAAMYWIQQGDWVFAGVLFGLLNIGAVGSFVFYDSLLPHVAREDELDRLSSAGYALGYLGGGIALFVVLMLIQHPAWFGLPDAAGLATGEGLSAAQASLPTRLSFVIVAVWWAVFSIPLFRRVSEPPALPRPEAAARIARGERPRPLLGRALLDLLQTLRDLVSLRQTLLMLIAFLVYNDGIGTIIRMAAPYGKEIGLDSGAMITAILMVQFVGIPFAFGFGLLADKIGAKRGILIGIGAYFLITLVAWRMETEAEFYLLAFLVGMVQGGTQALSRSLFASLIPARKSGEFFGLFAVLEKFAGVAGPLFFALASTLTGSSRAGLLSVIVFFAVGGLLLLRVDVSAGQEAARAKQRELEAADLV